MNDDELTLWCEAQVVLWGLAVQAAELAIPSLVMTKEENAYRILTGHEPQRLDSKT